MTPEIVTVTAAGLCRSFTGFPILPSRGTSCLSSVTIASTVVSQTMGESLPSSLLVVGIGADGWSRAARAPPASGSAPPRCSSPAPGCRRWCPRSPGQVREELPSPLRAGLRELMASYAGRSVVVVASGDPMVSGIGSTLVDLFGPEAVEVLPAVSSVALARARMRWSAESSQVVSLVARDPHLLLRQLAPGHRVLVLSSDETHTGVRGRAADVVRLRRLAGGRARRPRRRPRSRAPRGRPRPGRPTSPRLNVIALELDGPVIGSWAAGLPDDAFGNDGQLTKRDLRAGALARLAPQPGQLLWDVGAGAGSVGIEWMRAHPRCRAIAIEADEDRADPDRAQRPPPRRPAPRGGARPRTRTRSPTCPTRTRSSSAAVRPRPGCSTTCLARLRPGGRLVVHGVTLETETLLARLYAEHGGELTRHSVEHAAPIGSFTGWTPARAVTMWALDREGPVTVHFVGAGPGAADLLTLRAATLLSEAEVVLYPGTYLDEGFLVHVSPDAELVDTQDLDLDQIMARLHRGRPGRARGGAAGLRRPVGVLRADRADPPARRGRGARGT